MAESNIEKEVNQNIQNIIDDAGAAESKAIKEEALELAKNPEYDRLSPEQIAQAQIDGRLSMLQREKTLTALEEVILDARKERAHQ